MGLPESLARPLRGAAAASVPPGASARPLGRFVASVVLWALPPVLWTLAIDGAMRSFGPLSEAKRVGVYGLSSLYLLFVWSVILTSTTVLRQRRAYLGMAAVVILFAAMESVFVVSAWEHHTYFAVLPNVYAVSYLIDEPAEALASARVGLTAASTLCMLGYVLGAGAYLLLASARLCRWAVPRSSRSRRMAIAGALAAILAFSTYAVQNHVRLYPDCFVPQVHVGAAVVRAVVEEVRGTRRPTRWLTAGTRPTLATSDVPLPFNIVVVVNESLGRGHMSAYGYSRETTPELSALLATEAERVVLFQHAYANATRTVVAFPSLLTGVGPEEPVARTYREPLIFDYLGVAAQTRVFAITAHSWRGQNMDGFIDSKCLATRSTMDTRKTQNAIKGTDGVNAVASDDAEAVSAFDDMLAQLAPDQHIAGLVQFYGTHVTYYSDPQDQLWGTDSRSNSYDAAIRKVDRLTSKLMAALRARGMLDDTLLVVTSDHGDAFGEHGYSGHMQTFYDEEAAIPLWIHLPNAMLADPRLVAAVRANAALPVSNIDIVPTVVAALAFAGVQIPGPHQNGLRGASLLAPLPANRPIVMLNASEPSESYLIAGVGVLVWPYKLLVIERANDTQRLLLDLARDPAETRDVWADAPGTIRELMVETLRRDKSTQGFVATLKR